MHRTVTALWVILSAALCAAPYTSAAELSHPAGSSPLYESLVKGNNAFAVQLYDQLATETGNLFFSPYSISSAMGMTYAGARGNTAIEIKKTFQFRFDQAQLGLAFKGFNKELTTIAARSGQKLAIANGLCLTRGDVGSAFKTILKKDYHAELFSGGLEQINGWVAQKTEGKIRKILTRLNPDSVCVILNAIYFKGIWQSQFLKTNTSNGPFNVSSKKRVTAHLMYQQSGFRMLRGKQFRAVLIPYAGDTLSMIVFLPLTTNGLAEFEKHLTASNLDGWVGRLERQPVREIDLYLPKFKVETGYNLEPICIRMGMREAFTRKADFSGMKTPKGDIWISQIQHKAFVEVNETGTEAAGATAVEMATKSMPNYPIFRADHPFLFLIRDNRNGAILFMGRMVDPTSK